MPDITERIEKQMEGTNLALAAVAEILQKMDGRFSKEEQDVAAEAQQSAQANARASLVKSIASEVLSVVKGEGADMGLDVDGKERKAKGTGGTPQNADDSESSVTPTTKIEDQQNTIQAMQKQLNALKKEYEEENGKEKIEEEEVEKGGMAYKQDSMDEEIPEEASDEPIEEDEEVVDDEGEGEGEPDLVNMQKQIRALKKQVKASKTGMQKAIQTEAENRLRKMGFREETSLQAPKLTQGLGLDDLTPIAKAEGDVAGQLVDMSYQELRRLQQKIDTGDTNGLPRELVGK